MCTLSILHCDKALQCATLKSTATCAAALGLPSLYFNFSCSVVARS